MGARRERLDAIKRVIESKDISTQEELIGELEALGHEVTQATVSRDIGDLGLLKIRLSRTQSVSSSRQIYSLPDIERLRSLLNEFMRSIDRAENLVVVKVNPGTAQAIAAAIDAIKWPDVLGTVGGDDTILVVTRNGDVGSRIAERISKLHEERAL